MGQIGQFFILLGCLVVKVAQRYLKKGTTDATAQGINTYN